MTRDGPGPAAPTWLLSQRITEPDLPADYCERPELVERCALGRKRVTLLMAPAGFGKTTLLAACCRQARAGGVRTAWLSLAPDDTPGTLDDYLWHAFATTGLDPDAPGAVDGAGGDPPYPRTRAILRALERRRERCVLVLDDLEALSDRGSIDLVALLLRAAPPHLHVALSCRECPAGLDMTPVVFGPETVMLDVGDLRFSPSEVVRFFGSELSRTALADVMATSDGWPIMLRIARSDVAAPRGSDAVVRDVVASWIEGRLLRDFADHERELLLDLGLFEWFDARLVEDVLEQPGAFDRVTQMPQLTGLLVPLAGRGRNTYRVHPALRDFSEAYGRRKRERYRRIHRRIGRAMARRGETVAGMRHASAADDAQLAARMLVDAGGLAVWLREGAGELVAADRLLSEDAVAADPRLVPVRCVALAVNGDIARARDTLAAAEPALAAATAEGVPGLDVQLCLARAALARSGAPVDSAEVRALMAETRRLAALPILDPIARGAMEFGLCLYHGQCARFDVALEHGARARALVANRSSYLALVVNYTCGQATMAQGRVRETLRYYKTALRSANGRFVAHPRLGAMCMLLRREFDFERGVTPDDPRLPGLSKRLLRSGVDFGCYAAASDLAIEHARASGGTDAALSVLDDIWAQARRTGLPALERHLAAARVSMLADAGRTLDARETWRAAALPDDDAGCVDLDGQSWREMESVSCARLRLGLACGEYDATRRLGRAVDEAAAGRGLLRTRLRARALLIAAESAAGDHNEAVRLVGEYLGLCAASDYVRPLLGAGPTAGEALVGYLDAHPAGPHADLAERLVNVMSPHARMRPVFRGKQREVLRRLAAERDKQIAAALGLSTDGVRYHVRRIFGKLDVHDRAAAVRRARELGILPAD